MLNIPKVQVQVHRKLKLLIDEVSSFPETSSEIVDALKRIGFVNFNSLLSERSRLIRMFREIVIPLEGVFHPPLSYSPKVELNEDWADNILRNKLVIGVDTSEIMPSPHISPLFLLVNIGYQAIFYGEKLICLHGSTPNFYASMEIMSNFGSGHLKHVPSWILEVKRLDDEFTVIKGLLDSLPSRFPSYVFFDESFSVNYLSARSKEFRRKVVESLVEIHERLRDLNVVPIGVFYTRSRAFTLTAVKSIICTSRSCSDCIDSDDLYCNKFSSIRDSLLLDRVLEIGWRTPLFDVNNRVTEEFPSLNVLGFYVKVGFSNVLRVEFPSWCKDFVNEIHGVVLAQSILGRGYPYVLERAHEEAYINSRERSWVLSYIDRLLRSSGMRGLTFSGKFRRKVRGVV